MIFVITMLLILAGASFAGGVLATRELCHWATEKEREAKK